MYSHTAKPPTPLPASISLGTIPLSVNESSVYSEELAYQLIIDFIKLKSEMIAKWLVSELTSTFFIYTASENIGFVIDKDGNRQETRYLRIHLEKDLEGVRKIGFIITAISPIP